MEPKFIITGVEFRERYLRLINPPKSIGYNIKLSIHSNGNFDDYFTNGHLDEEKIMTAILYGVIKLEGIGYEIPPPPEPPKDRILKNMSL
jgi:hypothetical protein